MNVVEIRDNVCSNLNDNKNIFLYKMRNDKRRQEKGRKKKEGKSKRKHTHAHTLSPCL